jgi:2-keto-4-pentenoate hydratase/2-oxohepta-3-ene-1,7-dioic acid hydratase in catechol pathway
MKLYTFIENGAERLGVEAADDAIVDLAAASGNAAHFASMLALIESGPTGLNAARAVLDAPPASAIRAKAGLRLAAPIPRPPKLRGYSVFEKHLRQSAQGAARRLSAGAPDPEAAYKERLKALNFDNIPPPGWSQTPAYYLMDADCVVGHDTLVHWPAYSNWIDYELEIVAVVGRGGKDITRENVNEHIFGYTLVNDLSARDAQLKSMATGLGASKGKDFDGSNPMGPCIVTADEIADPYGLPARVLVNGEQWASSDGREAHFRFDQCIAYASQAQTIRPGEMFTTGTLPNCSSLELVKTVRRGDVIDFEVGGIGVLRTRIG